MGFVSPWEEGFAAIIMSITGVCEFNIIINAKINIKWCAFNCCKDDNDEKV